MPKIDITLGPTDVVELGKPKHTPGPWTACNDGKCKCRMVSSTEDLICTVTSGEWGDEYASIRLVGPSSLELKAEAYMEMIAYGNVPEGVALANARLISAAPDLLFALKQIIQDLPSKRDWLDPVLERMAKDAIAKAEPK